MRTELLAADLAELGERGLQPQEAFERGLAALGTRPTNDKPRARSETQAGAVELVHLVAEAAAEMHLLQFAYATRAADYDSSRRRYDAVDDAMRGLQTEVVPGLRARLRELRASEAALERELAARGLDPDAVGPKVPEGSAVDPTPKPGEGDEPRRTLPPLRPRRSLLERLLRKD